MGQRSSQVNETPNIQARIDNKRQIAWTKGVLKQIVLITMEYASQTDSTYDQSNRMNSMLIKKMII